MSTGLFFAFSNATEGNDADLNEWYDAVHIHEVCRIPGVISGQRYAVAPLDGAGPPDHSYLAVYEIEATPAEIMAGFGAAMQSGELTVAPSLDLTSMKMSFWAPHGPRVSGD